MELSGVWVPLVTPFRGGAVDFESMERLAEDLTSRGISGLVVGATTGEALALSEAEVLQSLRAVKRAVRGRVPVFAGVGGRSTAEAVASAKALEVAGAEGLLAVTPHYVRPDQRGILAHFEAIAAATRLPIVLYNIPSRTAARMENATIRQLAKIDHVVGLKDCAGDLAQSMELLLDPPPGFSILTGEDACFFTALTLGARGGILASAHWATEAFVETWRAVARDDLRAARALWARLLPAVRLLFEEPNPSPIKHVLHRTGKIASGELRLPLLEPTDRLKERLDAEVAPIAEGSGNAHDRSAAILAG